MPTLNGQDLIESGSSSTPPTGRLAFYPKSDHKLYIKDSTGLETQIGAQGPQGIQGIQGVKGDKGDKGDTGEGVHPGGTTNQVLVKNSNDDFDTSWQTFDFNNLQLQIDALRTRVDELEAQVAVLSNPVFPGPKVGVSVHLTNLDGDCVEAVIYEDYTKRNNAKTISVMYVDPDNPTWLKRADVKEVNGSTDDVPFNSWHMPEWNVLPTDIRMAYVRR